MKSHIFFFKLLILSIFTSYSVTAADIVVNGSGLSGTYTTISAAISIANSGDVIIVAAQSLPYIETLNIDKDLTIHPYGTNTYIDFEGDINITIDAISELILIGIKSTLDANIAQSNIYAQFNDTTRNSLTTIDIIDSKFNDVYLNLPKTSTYCSFSSFRELFISHGDVIACSATYLTLGMLDCGYTSSSNYSIDCLENFTPYTNQIGTGNNPSECGLFNAHINFGNVSTFSDTCNFISNNFYLVNIFTKDFPVNIRNNEIYYLGIFLLANSSKGTNQIINNGNFNPFGSWSASLNYVYLNLVFCSASNEFNFRDVSVRILNNYSTAPNNNPYIQLNEPQGIDYSLANLAPIRNSIFAYNSTTTIGLQYSTNTSLDPLPELLFTVGPIANWVSSPNPSSEFLNLDLSLNTYGKYGGSWSQLNYIDSIPNYQGNNYLPAPGFGSIGNNSKARITYLNLPTLIYDPATIQIKAKAVHGK